MAQSVTLKKLQKKSSAIPLFLDRLAKNGVFEVIDGPAILANQLYAYDADENVTVLNPAESVDFKKARKLLESARPESKFGIAHSRMSRGMTPITRLIFTAALGNNDAKIDTTDRETKSLIILKDSLTRAIAQNGGPITMSVGGKTYRNIVDVVSTVDTRSKSDYEMIDSSGKTVIWISAKAGTNPKDYHQWGGISETSEPRTFRHPETRKFIADLLKAYPSGLSSGHSLYRKIEDPDIKMSAVFGSNYHSGVMSDRNVTVLLQGDPSLARSGSSYQFKASHVVPNGRTFDGTQFEPVFFATYVSMRPGGYVPNARIDIRAIGGRRADEFKNL